MPKVNPEQFAKQKDQMLREQRVADGAWAKEQYTKMGGDEKNNYLILKNGSTIIGIFSGFFEGNMLTFNPGWDENGKNMKKWDDVRVIQQHLKSKGINIMTETDSTTEGPAFFMVQDPDGNILLFDQHR
jgi:predicted enzyme related to lactoylglutathione lyase